MNVLLTIRQDGTRLVYIWASFWAYCDKKVENCNQYGPNH